MVGKTIWDLENFGTYTYGMFLMRFSAEDGTIMNKKVLDDYSPLTGINPTSVDTPHDLKIDVVGNIYIAGVTRFNFADDTPSDFGIWVSGNTLTYNRDIIVAKFDKNFTPLWAKQFGKQTIVNGYGQGDTTNYYTEGDDESPSLALDKYNRPYVTFTTRGADWNNAEKASNFGEPAASSSVTKRDPVIVKLNHETGDIYWMKQFGASTMMGSGSNSGDDGLYGITFDSDNNMFLTGYTTGSPIESNGGGKDMIFIKLSAP